MKRKLFPLLVILVMTSCSPEVFYKQITTLASEDVKLFEDGTYACIKPELTISYNFWSSNGSVDFAITNNTDEDIMIDLSKSFFVFNGNAYDYYLNRRFVNTSVSSSTSGRAYGVSRSISYGLGAAVNAQFSNAIYTNVPGAVGASASASGAASAEASESSTFSRGFSVEYEEKPVVCIPAHTSRIFGEYSLPNEVYRECGFIRDPESDETAVLEFDSVSSPIKFENRLSFLIDGAEKLVVNSFFVRKIENINEDEVMKWIDVKTCSGDEEGIRINTAAAANRYSIEYNVNGGTDRKGRKNADDYDTSHFDGGWVPLYKRR